MSKQHKIREKYELDEVDKRILELRLRHPGITDREIGTFVGLSRRAVSVREHRPAFKAIIDQYVQEPLDAIRGALKKAARVIVKSLDSQDEKVRLRAAVEVLRSEGILKREPDESAQLMEPTLLITSREIHAVFDSRMPEVEKARVITECQSELAAEESTH